MPASRNTALSHNARSPIFPSLRLNETYFRDGREVIPLLAELHSLAFPQADDPYIAPLVRDVESMFHDEQGVTVP